MKFLSTLAVIASSVNARCDFDLTKPTYNSCKGSCYNSTDYKGITLLTNYLGTKDSLVVMRYGLKADHKGTLAECEI